MKIKNLLLNLLVILAINQVKSQSSLTIAEDFLVKDVNGISYYLRPILDEGITVVLSFFTTTCGSCNIYTPEIQESFNDFGCNEGDVFYLGVNWGSDNIGVTDFIAVHALGFPCASGEEGLGDQVNIQYDIASHITVLIVTPDRQIAAQFYGPNDYPTREALQSALLNLGVQMQNCSVGIPELDEKKSSIYKLKLSPNPVSSIGNLEIFASKTESCKIEIYNSLGFIAYSSQIHLDKGKNEIPLEWGKYRSGLYFVKITDEENRIQIEKILKR